MISCRTSFYGIMKNEIRIVIFGFCVVFLIGIYKSFQLLLKEKTFSWKENFGNLLGEHYTR